MIVYNNRPEIDGRAASMSHCCGYKIPSINIEYNRDDNIETRFCGHTQGHRFIAEFQHRLLLRNERETNHENRIFVKRDRFSPWHRNLTTGWMLIWRKVLSKGTLGIGRTSVESAWNGCSLLRSSPVRLINFNLSCDKSNVLTLQNTHNRAHNAKSRRFHSCVCGRG